GRALASAGLFGIVWGLVRGNAQGWASTEIVTALTAGAILVAAFVVWELRAVAPMLPMRFFRNRVFALANVASLLMFFGMFGSIFLLSQFFQTVQGDRKSTRLNSSHGSISYSVFCLNKILCTSVTPALRACVVFAQSTDSRGCGKHTQSCKLPRNGMRGSLSTALPTAWTSVLPQRAG